MSDSTRVVQQEGLSFDVELHGHHFTIDAVEAVGGKDRGPRPKGLLLSALAGCTGMDVASILQKMRMPYDSFAVEVDADLAEKHPKVYTEIRLRYVFTGAELDKEKIEKAVDLSQDVYCGVTAMLSKAAEVKHEIVLNP